MRSFYRSLRIISAVTLFFFVWSFLPLYSLVAYAAAPEGPGARGQGPGARVQDAGKQGPGAGVQGSGGSAERFEKALETIRENVSRAGEKAVKGEDDSRERDVIKAKRAEIESADGEFRKEFSATEKKLKDAKLPKEILDRHYKFVKNYEDNLKELRANLDGVEQAKTKSDRKVKIEKARLHLEKVKAPSKHQKLDPNNLPFRARKAGKTREPRLRKNEFERDFPKQHKAVKMAGLQTIFAAYGHGGARTKNKPVQLAFNGPASDAPFQLPLPLRERTEVRGGIIPNSAFAIPNWDTLNADSSPYLLAQQTADLPSPDDLSEAPPAIQFTPAIRAKAQNELGCNPTKIYNWVRNNINYEPYYGSFKSADQTLLEGAGNDFDQASLLISLMRVCNISAKYAYGTVEIPADQAANMVGASDAKMAATILATQGIPVKTVMSGGTVKAIQMERAWVEAFIDYFPSWGARHKQGSEDTWISLDSAFKQYTYKQGMDMYAQMGFNGEDFLMSYIADTRDIMAYQDYGARLVDFIDANYPDATIDQVFGASDIKSTKTIVKQEFPYLLGTLPYKTIVKAAQFSQVPPSKDYTIAIQIEGNAFDSTSGLNYSGSLNYLADKRVTVSYEPATSADEALVAQYGENILSVPPHLLTVKPILKISSTTVATGAPIGLGQDQNIVISFAGPDGDTDRIQNIITAGNYSAIILQSQDTPADTPSKNMAMLIENSKKVYPSDVSLDDLLGQLLYSIGVSYFQKLSFENKVYANTLQLINLRQPAEAMVTHKVKVSYLFGLPLIVSESGLNMDVDRNINIVVTPTQDSERIKSFMILSGLSSSAWENRILEAFLDIPAASTVRLLKLASDQGIPVYTIDSTNLNDMLPQLQIAADVKADIANAVNAGKKVIISKSNVTYNQWNGVGYIVMNPSTGAAGYMISGGLAGSDQTAPPSTPLRQGQLPDSTVEIRGLVLRIARAFTGTPYVWGGKTEAGFDCSGFVHELFELAGPKVDKGNAAMQYGTCGTNKWLLPWNDRLAGDIIWKSDLKHVGIETGTNEITWRGNPYNGETAIHASGRPCYTDVKYAPKAPSKCISTSCELIDPTQPELGGNPPCGEFNTVIESPIGFFAKTRKEFVCRPK